MSRLEKGAPVTRRRLPFVERLLLAGASAAAREAPPLPGNRRRANDAMQDATLLCVVCLERHRRHQHHGSASQQSGGSGGRGVDQGAADRWPACPAPACFKQAARLKEAKGAKLHGPTDASETAQPGERRCVWCDPSEGEEPQPCRGRDHRPRCCLRSAST